MTCKPAACIHSTFYNQQSRSWPSRPNKVVDKSSTRHCKAADRHVAHAPSHAARAFLGLDCKYQQRRTVTRVGSSSDLSDGAPVCRTQATSKTVRGCFNSTLCLLWLVRLAALRRPNVPLTPSPQFTVLHAKSSRLRSIVSCITCWG